MDEELRTLIESLTQPQRSAIAIIKLSLDCFNSAEGTGLFTGMNRYSALAGRVEICAAQANNLTQFWALLLRRMQWPLPPAHADARLLACLSAAQPLEILRTMASETASICTLARMWHSADKAARKAALA